MFSKSLRYLMSATFFICLIGINCYSSDRNDLNEKAPFLKSKYYEKLDEQNLVKKIEAQNIEARYICIYLEYTNNEDIKKYTRNEFIESLTILADTKCDPLEHKKKFLKLMKRNKYISKLGITGSFFDTSCVKKIPKKGIVKSLGLSHELRSLGN